MIPVLVASTVVYVARTTALPAKCARAAIQPFLGKIDPSKRENKLLYQSNGTKRVLKKYLIYVKILSHLGVTP